MRSLAVEGDDTVVWTLGLPADLLGGEGRNGYAAGARVERRGQRHGFRRRT